MKKKKKTMFDEPCVVCGRKFGDDDRAFVYQKNKPTVCHPCQIKTNIDEMTPKQRLNFLKSIKDLGGKYKKYIDKALMNPKPKEDWEKEFDKKDGIGVRLFVDLMIANKGDKKIVKEKIDELLSFIQSTINQEVKEALERVRLKEVNTETVPTPMIMPKKDRELIVLGYNAAKFDSDQKIKKELEEK